MTLNIICAPLTLPNGTTAGWQVTLASHVEQNVGLVEG